MNSVNEIKARIEKLELNQLASLERWLDEREDRARGKLKECFVIMPFSMTRDGRSNEYWMNFFEHFLKPSLGACGYQARRSAATPENIVKCIMEELAWSELVLAVLTDLNVNVWYELGVRHSLQRGRTVMACQQDQISALPFDLKHHGVAGYAPSLDRVQLIEELKQHISPITEETFDSPVSEFLNSGLYYCINRALAHQRSVMRLLRQFRDADNEEIVLKAVDQLNAAWLAKEMQLTIVRDDKILRHRGDVAVGTRAVRCWEDMILGNQSLYPQMKSEGKGLRLGAIKDCFGRLTAIAFDSLSERNWLVVVEAHIKQGGL